MIPALALLALLASPVETEVRLSNPRALSWTVVPSMVDLWATGYALHHGGDRVREWQRFGQTPDQRAAAKVGVSVLMAWGFQALENHPRHKSKAWRLPRYVWAAAHLGIAFHNIRQARK